MEGLNREKLQALEEFVRLWFLTCIFQMQLIPPEDDNVRFQLMPAKQIAEMFIPAMIGMM